VKRILVSVLTPTAVICGALAASAQPQSARPERPYRGVYASGTDQAKHLVTVEGAAGSGYDTNVLLGETQNGLGALNTPLAGEGGLYNLFGGRLNYASSLNRLGIGASVSSSLRQYPQLDLDVSTSHAASGGMTLGLGRNQRTRLSANAGLTYQTMRGFVPVSSGFTSWFESASASAAEFDSASVPQVSAPSQDFGGALASYYTVTTSAGLTQELSARSSVTVAYDRHASEFKGGSDDFREQTGSARFSRKLTRDMGVRLGYGYTDATYRLGRSYEHHNIDTGIDYSRYLSRTRRTRISFSTGAGLTQQDGATVQGALGAEEYQQFDVTGSASLTREIGRTWLADVTYRRNSGFVESVRAPLFYDAVGVGLKGEINRRLLFESGVSGSIGHVGLRSSGTDSNGYDTWTGYTSLTVGLRRNLALVASYTYYRYTFEETAALVTGLASDVNRHSVNVTINVWAPVLKRGRRTDATR
jgi:hypothetical protein